MLQITGSVLNIRSAQLCQASKYIAYDKGRYQDRKSNFRQEMSTQDSCTSTQSALLALLTGKATSATAV
jgi:hypothetical protein